MSLYKHPPSNTHVVCVDELGPLGTKWYPGQRWRDRADYPGVMPNYGKKGSLWVFGAFEPATGMAFTRCSDRRRSVDFVDFLEAAVACWPDGEIILIMDNLSVHRTLDVQLWLLMHPRVRILFQPTYAPWLNLIEPWWKRLKNLALKGRSFTSRLAIIVAIARATDYWNTIRYPYRWRKSA